MTLEITLTPAEVATALQKFLQLKLPGATIVSGTVKYPGEGRITVKCDVVSSGSTAYMDR